MNAGIRFLIAAIVVCAGWGLYAQETDEPKIGKLLLLRGGHVMEGEIERVGSTQIRVRNGTSEIFISTEKAARICGDWNDAYVYLQSLVKLEDANDRVKLARWCHTNKLGAQALEQAKYALELQPGHPEAMQIVATLERSAKEPEPTPTMAPAKPSGSIRAKEVFQLVDVATETQLTFATKVQPILMNTCATCHCTGRGGRLELDRVANSAQKAATQRNLAKVLTYINLDHPSISPLLERAIKTHGGATHPSIHNRDAKAFQTLQQWIETTVARNPHLRAYAAAKRELVGGRGQESGVRSPETDAVPVSQDARPLTSGFGQAISPPVPKEAQAPSSPVTKKGQGDPQTSAPANDNSTPPRVLPKSVTETVPAVQAPEDDDPFAASKFNDAYHPKR